MKYHGKVKKEDKEEMFQIYNDNPEVIEYCEDIDYNSISEEFKK